MINKIKKLCEIIRIHDIEIFSGYTMAFSSPFWFAYANPSVMDYGQSQYIGLPGFLPPLTTGNIIVDGVIYGGLSVLGLGLYFHGIKRAPE